LSAGVAATFGRELVAEGLATALLLAVVVGSGIMSERLADANVALALLANSIATGAGLVALILTFGPISGAQMNPLVTLLGVADGTRSLGKAVAVVFVQVSSAFAGVALAHLMFGKTVFAPSPHVRAGSAQIVSEFVATFGLIGVIRSCSKHHPHQIAVAVGAYITAAYWFTASTSFANPAVTLARTTTATFAGIRPLDAPWFIVAQVLGAGAAHYVFKWLLAGPPAIAAAGSPRS
jgi:glycerol uptake facilitator-like aquaporin